MFCIPLYTKFLERKFIWSLNFFQMIHIKKELKQNIDTKTKHNYNKHKKKINRKHDQNLLLNIVQDESQETDVFKEDKTLQIF